MHPPIMRKTKPILYKFVVQFQNDNVVICDTLDDAERVRDNMVSVGYDSDVAQVQALLLEAALNQPRVLRDPGPIVQLSNFGADGLEFTVGYWINDPEVGQGGLKSDINLAILAALGGMLVALVSQMPVIGWRLVADALTLIQLRCVTDAAASQGLARETTQALFDALRQALPREVFEPMLAQANQAVIAWQRSRRVH